MSVVAVARPAARPHWIGRYQDQALPLWLRVASYAEAHADGIGHCPLTPEQLWRAVSPYGRRCDLSKAITTAIRYRWLAPTSGARCLVLARASADLGQCPATHRGQR